MNNVNARWSGVPSLTATVLGIVWGLVGVAKVLAPTALAAYLANRHSLEPSTANGFALGLGCSEALLGLALALSAWIPRPRAPLFAVSLVAAVAATAEVLLTGVEAHGCGCFGRLIVATRSRRLVVAGTVVALSSLGLMLSGRLTGRPIGAKQS